MPFLLAAAGGVVSAIGGIANAVANMSASDRAAAAQDKAFKEWLKVQIPDPKQQELALQKFVSAGELDPKLETAIKQNPSEFKSIATSAGDKIAQNRALQEMQDIGNQGGLRLQDKAALQDAQMQSNIKARADRDAIAANAARKGQGGSGFELAAQLQSQQSGADRDANSSLKVAAGAQDRALQAIMQGGDLATKYRGQDFSEQAQKAAAQDAINRFNSQNMQSVQQRNVGSQNAAQQFNLQNAQDISNKNTGMMNEQQRYNKNLQQQQFENQMRVAAGKSGQYAQQGALEQQKGQQLGNAFSNIGGGIGGALNSGAQNQYWSDYFSKKKPPADPNFQGEY